MKKLISKTLLAVIFTVGLVGCAVKVEDIKACEALCKPNGGMLNIQDAPFGFHCRCANGLVKTFN